MPCVSNHFTIFFCELVPSFRKNLASPCFEEVVEEDEFASSDEVVGHSAADPALDGAAGSADSTGRCAHAERFRLVVFDHSEIRLPRWR
jgi:hypothetical protein